MRVCREWDDVGLPVLWKSRWEKGINFQWDVAEIDALYLRAKAMAPDSIYLEMEQKKYQCANEGIVKKQFIVQDPDGYLFRFCSNGE